MHSGEYTVAHEEEAWYNPISGSNAGVFLQSGPEGVSIWYTYLLWTS